MVHTHQFHYKPINTEFKRVYNESGGGGGGTLPRMKDWGTFTSLSQLETFLADHTVSQGIFTGLQIGDYFTLGSYTVYIAGFDTEFNKGDTALTTHHISCIANFGESKMNSSNTTAGGYNGASVMQSFLVTKATELRNICDSHLLVRKVLLSNALSGGKSSNWAWYDKYLTLMSETQVYGSIQWGNQYDTGEGYEKLPIFNTISPVQLFGRVYFWLRGVRNTTDFCRADAEGIPGSSSAGTSRTVIALFCLG